MSSRTFFARSTHELLAETREALDGIAPLIEGMDIENAMLIRERPEMVRRSMEGLGSSPRGGEEACIQALEHLEEVLERLRRRVSERLYGDFEGWLVLRLLPGVPEKEELKEVAAALEDSFAAARAQLLESPRRVVMRSSESTQGWKCLVRDLYGQGSMIQAPLGAAPQAGEGESEYIIVEEALSPEVLETVGVLVKDGMEISEAVRVASALE